MNAAFRRALDANTRRPPQQSQNYLIEIEGEDSNLLSEQCREITISLGSIEVEEMQSGSVRFGLPRNATVSRLELTFALDNAGVIMRYFKDWKASVMTPDGYFGIPFGPNGFVKRVTVTARDNVTFEPTFEIRQMLCFPETLGQLNFSNKEAQAMELQVTLVRFMAELDRE